MTMVDGISQLHSNALHLDIMQSGVSVGADRAVGEASSEAFVHSVIGPLDAVQVNANEAVARFSQSGSPIDYTEAVLAVSKIRNDIALYATLRDKMIQSYHQLLHMQI